MYDKSRKSPLITRTVSTSTSTPTKSPSPVIQKLNFAEMTECHDCGLCYNCDEKFTHGHRRKRQTLFHLEVVDDTEHLIDMDIVNEEEDTHHAIFLHALTKKPTPSV
ncbi:hypothetical protein CFOL_v3_24453 [Cephalotus follicularis]|uniref:Uncharacterized protein n=1 Tax=Cephalotus follicularis TaxID=3775 RepID=A0A1Q3CL67_CEPFO|nr:hypothetical protein CFOL_v3_24453 [Cephalotus follicularis]